MVFQSTFVFPDDKNKLLDASRQRLFHASQSIVDGPKNKWRRGRAAAVNFVPTSTGAAKATTKVLTELEGKFNGIAVRGPVPAGSVADMVFVTRKATSESEINDVFRDEARSDRYSGIQGVSDDPIVSCVFRPCQPGASIPEIANFFLREPLTNGYP